MDATQLIDDSILESEEEEEGEENGMNKTDKQGQPLAKLKVLTNEHIPEAELPLYQGDNVIGRDPGSCSVTLLSRSVSKQHAVISIAVFRGNRQHGNMETEALVWDLGSMNGTRKCRTKLSPQVRYALADGEGVVLADIPCQYISVAKNKEQGDMKCSTNRDSGMGIRTEPDSGKTQLREGPSPVVQGLGCKTDTTDSTRLFEIREVNGKIKDLSSVELGVQVNIPPKTKLLSFEQTPKQSAEQTLAPESESDEEGEGRRNKNQLFVSASASHWSNPTCSSFLSPTSTVIPESEDESSITPHSSAKDRPSKPGNPLSFSDDDSDVNIQRQQPRKRRARMIVDDSEEEERKEEEAPRAKETRKIAEGKEVSLNVAEQVVEAGRDGEAVPVMLADFNMDSDTDVEEDEEMRLDAPVNGVQPVATIPPDPGLVLTDSHADTEEQGSSKLLLAATLMEQKPEDPYGLDSDTDVEDDVDVSNKAFKAMSSISDPVQKADPSAPTVQSSEFHLDSDTDKKERTQTPSTAVPESGSIQSKAAPQDILLDSDTEEEDNRFDPAGSKTAELHSPLATLEVAAALEIRSDSDTEYEAPETTAPPVPDDTIAEGGALASPETSRLLATTTTTSAVTASVRCQDSGSDTDVEEEGLGHKAELVPESDLSEPGAFRVDSDTDVEEDVPDQARMQAAGPGSQQKCSTPLASSVQEEMETQAFFCPLEPFRRPPVPLALRPTLIVESSGSESDSLEENDFVVAETQPFVLEGQSQRCHSEVDPILEATQPYHLQPCQGSFQLGLSDSSPLQPEAEDQAAETTNSFSSPDEELEATQAYGAVATVDRTLARGWTTESVEVFNCPDGESDLEATQAYGSGEGSKEPGHGHRSAVFGRAGQVGVSLEAKQVNDEQLCSASEESQDTQPLLFPTTSSVSAAETLPRSACGEEEGLLGVKPSSPVRRGSSWGEEDQGTQIKEVLTDKCLSTAETLEQEDETKTATRSQRQPIEEQETQAVSYQHQPIEEQETQAPMLLSNDEEDDEEEDRKEKRLAEKEPEAAAETCCVQGGGGARVEGEEPKRLTRGQAVLSLRGRRREVLLGKDETDPEEEVVQEHKTEKEEQDEAKTDEQNNPKTPGRSHRATARRTNAVASRTKPVPDQDVASGESEPALASRTRAHSNSTNSVNSESVAVGQGNRGRGRGRGGRKTSNFSTAELGSVPPARSSTRRRTVAGSVEAPTAGVEGVAMQLPSEEVDARTSRSSSASSLKSEVSSNSVASETSQGKGRGVGRGRTGRGRKTNADLGPKVAGGRSCKQEDQPPHPERDPEAGATRGQKRIAKSSKADPVVDEEMVTAQITEQSPLARGNGRGRARGGQKHSLAGSSAPTPTEQAPTPTKQAPTPGGRPAQKRQLEDAEDSTEFKVPQVNAKFPRGARHEAADETSEEQVVSPAVRRSRASSAMGRKTAAEDRIMEEAGPGQGKASGRRSVGQTDREGNAEDLPPSSTEQDEACEVTLTPTGKGTRKRSSPVESSPLAKTSRSSSLTSLSSPGSRSRAASQTCKVLFTGLVDEEGEKVVYRLGGSLAKGVTDMTHLVTDRVRRTVKFLCAVARGVPIVTTKWLEKSGEAGSFLSTDLYLVKDGEQENKFSFCLEESLRSASTQPLLQGYQVHVTRSVLPEPGQMKDIITCSGARFLPKMPSSVKAQTVVISCGDDWSLCAPALSATLPVLSAEFLLTGILQQKVDLLTHALSAPKSSTQPGNKGQGRGRKKS
ncbi:hypothetical protein UPYG_G00150310 [Umbra pygmaea]|uniref:Mediator of DNA damage checkpoint protein 1 n=1 Tax=Umbra pygmaea TaxID=75934 RepID=A0ABD0X140_UMBPY